jgi:hypothetical protein
MVTGDIVAGDLVDISNNLIIEVGRIGLWLKGLGIVVILWILFNLVNLVINKRREQKMEKYDLAIKRIEKKIDRITKKMKV